MLPIPAITCWSSSNGLSVVDRRRSNAAELVGARVVDERVDAERGDLGKLGVDVVGVVDDHLPERAGVDEQQIGSAEVEDDVGVHRALGAGFDEEHLAGHAQVDHQRVARVEWTQEVLAAASGARSSAVPVRPSIRAWRDVRRTVRSRPTSTPSIRRPTTSRSNPRRTVSTSGSSGIEG